VPAPESVLVDPDLFGGTDSFALRVQGDSMIEAGIHPGDLVIVRPQRTAHNGVVVVALIDDEDATVKFYHDKGRYLELRPANEAYAKNYPIVAHESVTPKHPQVPADLERRLAGHDFAWSARNRAAILTEWKRRYGAKSGE